MSAVSFRYLNGLVVLLTHVICIGMLTWAGHRFSSNADQVGSSLIITPITLAYTLAFIKFVLVDIDRTHAQSDAYNLRGALVLTSITIVFGCSLIYVVFRFIFESAYAVNDFKMWLAAMETAFGGLVGLIFERIFGVTVERPASDARGVPDAHLSS